MKHNIPIYARNMDSNEMPLWIPPMFLSLLLAFVSMFGLGLGQIWTILFFSGLTLLVLNIGLYCTHVNRTYTKQQRHLMAAYNYMPKELKRQVPLSKKIIGHLEPGECKVFNDDINRAVDAYTERKRIEKAAS